MGARRLTLVGVLDHPRGVVVGPDGTLLVTTDNSDGILRVTPQP